MKIRSYKEFADFVLCESCCNIFASIKLQGMVVLGVKDPLRIMKIFNVNIRKYMLGR